MKDILYYTLSFQTGLNKLQDDELGGACGPHGTEEYIWGFIGGA